MNPAAPPTNGRLWPLPDPVAPPPVFSWRATILSIWESEGVLSSRLISACIVTLVGLVLQLWASHKAGLTKEQIEMVEHYVDADFIFAGSLFGLGVGKVALSRFSPKPTVDPTQQQPKPDAAAASA